MGLGVDIKKGKTKALGNSRSSFMISAFLLGEEELSVVRSGNKIWVLTEHVIHLDNVKKGLNISAEILLKLNS